MSEFMMILLPLLLLFSLIGTGVFLTLQQMERKKRLETEAENEKLRIRNSSLEKFAVVKDAETEARRLMARAQNAVSDAEGNAKIILNDAQYQADTIREEVRLDAEQSVKEARNEARELKSKVDQTLNEAVLQADRIVKTAESRAGEISGSAWEVKQNARHYEDVVRAMRNRIDGYGDTYTVPVHSLLDDLAEQFSHKHAGAKLKEAREFSQRLVKQGLAADCDYTERGRKESAERFVLDAFDGMVDTILARVKTDNVGKLSQEIRDAFSLINFNGQGFRNARITEGYLLSRLEELKWAVVVQQLKEDERLEQRRIREQIREEEKARKEFERARKEAEKEEGTLREAMAKAQAEIDRATEAQRGEYEQKLAELTAKLKEAEERGQRAISMAQQTRRGHVYIISNTGSLGENVYKIGLTRRLEPQERIDELGDASVPFSFDVHAIIFSEDAPELERRLHRHFVLNQVNKVNHRKEFFRTDLAHIRNEIEGLGVQASWTMMSEAADYRESQAIERRIAEDPTAKEAWINRQLVMEVAVPLETETETAAEDVADANEEILNKS